MEQFAYLSVLLSIIIGLGMSHIIVSAARLIRHRDRVHLYVPTLLWMAVLFLVQIQIWWSGFIGGRGSWTFSTFLLALALPTGAFFLSYLLVPEFYGRENIDLHSDYNRNRHWFFSILALLPIASLTGEFLRTGQIHSFVDALFRISFIAIALLGFVIANDKFHKALSVFAVIVIVAYIAVLFSNLT